jgi:hypothetical protein
VNKRKWATSAPPSPERPARKAQCSNRSSRIIHDSEDEVEEPDSEPGDYEKKEVNDGQCTEEDVSRAYAQIQADRLAEGCNKKVSRYLLLFVVGTHFRWH